MIEAATIVAITAGAFIGTNLDNLILLVAFYSRYHKRSQTVTAGYVSGMLLIGIIFFLIGKSGDFIPVNYLGLLGIVPIIIGMTGLIQLFRPATVDSIAAPALAQQQKAVFFAVLMTQLGNGADTIITFSVLLADSTDKIDLIILPAFLAMVMLFTMLARYSLKHPRFSSFLDRFGRYITPVILILVGWYVLSDTATDLVQ